MALIGHTHLFLLFLFYFLCCVNEKIIKRNKKEIKIKKTKKYIKNKDN